MTAGLVIVGGCYAASQIAASARQAGYEDPIRILSEETDAPYQRPPLSKGFLVGDVADASLPLRGASFYAEQGISLELGVRVVSIERGAKTISTSAGTRLSYETLALATGSRPRRLALEGAELDGVFTLRSLADSRTIKERLSPAQDVVVIGGGFIGLEVAASCAKLGKHVAVVEAQSHLMSRALPPLLANWFKQLHERHGVVIHLSSGVEALAGRANGVRAVTLADGKAIRADLVVVGIGVIPNDELARAAGLQCNDGILVDRFARTSDPSIVAAGDCTRHPNEYGGGLVRLESVQNAIDQARTAAATVAHKAAPYDAVPWFWSDQYDTRLQMAGLCAVGDEPTVRGSLESGKFSVYYRRHGKLVAVHSVGRPGEHMIARKLIAARIALSADQAADEALDLRSLLP